MTSQNARHAMNISQRYCETQNISHHFAEGPKWVAVGTVQADGLVVYAVQVRKHLVDRRLELSAHLYWQQQWRWC